MAAYQGCSIDPESVHRMQSTQIAITFGRKVIRLLPVQALGKKLTNAGMVRGQMERILHARVPIIKFKHSATGQNMCGRCHQHLVICIMSNTMTSCLRIAKHSIITDPCQDQPRRTKRAMQIRACMPPIKFKYSATNQNICGPVVIILLQAHRLQPQWLSHIVQHTTRL